MKALRRMRLGVAAVVGMMAATALGQVPQGQIVYEAPSQYQKITILDTPGGYRQMIFDAKWDGNDAVQTQMNKAKPTELTLAYARYMVAPIALVEKPKRILIVGLGGGSLQKYLHEVLPETRIDTVELDPVVLTMAEKYFQFKQDARQVVAIGDGRKFLEQSKDKYDVLMLDAFSATSIPYLLATKEFLQVCKDHVSEGGLVAANLWEAEENYGSMLKTYDAVFPEWHVVRCAWSTNAVLTAFPAKRELTPEKWMETAGAFEKTYKMDLNLPQLIDKGYVPAARMPTTAKVLLDKDEPKGK